jgi:hypothetical protein
MQEYPVWNMTFPNVMFAKSEQTLNSEHTHKFRDTTSFGPFSVETFTEENYRRNVVSAQVNTFLDNLDATK